MPKAPLNNKECEICDNPATYFCKCDACRKFGGSIDPDDEQRVGRWVCEDCRGNT